MTRWIWHGWQSPEVKKLKDWWIDLLPPDWARGVSSNIFPFDYLQPKRCSWLYSLPAFRLLLARSSGWLEPGQAAVAGAVHGHQEQNASLSMTLSMIRFLPFYVFSLAPSPLLSLPSLFPYSFIFLFFLIFLFLCSGIVIWHQCYSGLKNMLLFH